VFSVGFDPLFFYEILKSRICFVMRFQQRFVFVGYEISIRVGFVGSRGLNDGRFSVSVCFVLLRSVFVGFSGLRDLSDGRFSVSVSFVLL